MSHFAGGAETTGRFLVLFEEGEAEAGAAALSDVAGMSVRGATLTAGEPDAGSALVFEELGVAVVDALPDQRGAVAAVSDESPAILAIEPERIVYALEILAYTPTAPATGNGVHGQEPETPPAPPAGRSADYLQGFRDAVLHLTAPAGTLAAAQATAAAALDESQATWGLQATKVVNCCRTGKGIKVAVLDTGLDLQHPDFAGRAITSQSFIPGQAVQDGHGHGTHCIGTALGPKCPPTRPRYGIAYEATIFAGKVLSNAGSGTDSQILGGINWAMVNKCEIVSMSLGGAVAIGQAYSTVFETVARRATQAGTLIIAAAGNNGPGRPVNHPANCPSILAVAALDSNLAVAGFSARGLNTNGGRVDVAGPGVSVHSTVPMPTRYGRKNGTSMATPHAAGVAALLAEANPGVRGAALGQLLTATCRSLPGVPAVDAGAGLVQAP
jgi:subtilisin family serine protease